MDNIKDIICEIVKNNIKIEDNKIICTDISKLTKAKYDKIIKVFTSCDNKEFKELEIGNLILKHASVMSYRYNYIFCYVYVKNVFCEYSQKEFNNVLYSQHYFDPTSLKQMYEYVKIDCIKSTKDFVIYVGKFEEISIFSYDVSKTNIMPIIKKCSWDKWY